MSDRVRMNTDLKFEEAELIDPVDWYFSIYGGKM